MWVKRMHVFTVVPTRVMPAGDTGTYDRHIISAVQATCIAEQEAYNDDDFAAVTRHPEHQ